VPAGKTETTKDLGKALGVNCVVFNCGENLDFRFMVRAGWGCWAWASGALTWSVCFQRIGAWPWRVWVFVGVGVWVGGPSGPHWEIACGPGAQGRNQTKAQTSKLCTRPAWFLPWGPGTHAVTLLGPTHNVYGWGA